MSLFPVSFVFIIIIVVVLFVVVRGSLATKVESHFTSCVVWKSPARMAIREGGGSCNATNSICSGIERS